MTQIAAVSHVIPEISHNVTRGKWKKSKRRCLVVQCARLKNFITSNNCTPAIHVHCMLVYNMPRFWLISSITRHIRLRACCWCCCRNWWH